MKKKVAICLSIVFALAIATFAIIFISKDNEQFYLEDSYYGANSVTEIKIDELTQLINSKESFALFVYQPMCVASSDFERILTDFLEDSQISIYKVAYSDIKDTELGKSVEYYPSFVIYNKGEVVDFLETDKDEDTERYTSKEGFESWFTKYVKLRRSSPSDSNSPDDSGHNSISKEINLENVVREDDKVNIYFFWGDGCNHCESEFNFFESIKDKYGSHYNLYTFETWYDEENAELINIFAEKMGDEVTGIPYTIIGDKSFKGFGENYKKGFINAIENQHENSFDVYFDIIKK